MLNMIRFLYVRGDYTSSRDLAKRALKIWTEMLGDAHPDTLSEKSPPRYRRLGAGAIMYLHVRGSKLF